MRTSEKQRIESGYSAGYRERRGSPASVPAGMTIEHHRCYDEMETLAVEWNGFLKRCGTDSIFLTWEYLSTWWDSYQDRYDMHVLVVRGRGGELLGIAPMVTGRGEGVGRRHLRHLAFMGAIGESMGECEDFMVLRGREEEVMRAFGAVIFGELSGEWDVLFLAMVPAESASMRAWKETLDVYGAWAMELNRYQAYCRPLPGDWESYLASRSSHFRSNFRRKWKKLEKEHRIRVLKAGEGCAIDEALAALISLNRERWRDDGQAFLTEQFNRFHLNLARILHAKEWVNIAVIEVDGKPGAVCYGFAYGEKYSVLQTGWDPAFARQSIGLLALGMGQKLAMESGLRELDLMSGGEEYKKMWATGSRELVDYETANPNSLRAMGFQRLRSLRNLVMPS